MAEEVAMVALKAGDRSKGMNKKICSKRIAVANLAAVAEEAEAAKK